MRERDERRERTISFLMPCVRFFCSFLNSSASSLSLLSSRRSGLSLSLSRCSSRSSSSSSNGSTSASSADTRCTSFKIKIYSLTQAKMMERGGKNITAHLSSPFVVLSPASVASASTTASPSLPLSPLLPLLPPSLSPLLLIHSSIPSLAHIPHSLAEGQPRNLSSFCKSLRFPFDAPSKFMRRRERFSKLFII